MKLTELYQRILTESVDTDELKRIGKSLLNFTNDKITDFVKWIDQFPSSGKAPAGMKKDFEDIKWLKKSADTYKEYKIVPQPIGATFSRWDESYIDRLVDAFFNTKTERTSNITIGNLFFVNESAMASSRFKETSAKIAKFLQRFDGFHKKALVGKLEIYFTSSNAFRAKAIYRSTTDKIMIKESNAREVDTEAYGYLLYILVHELGHRFEFKSKVPLSFRDEDFYTTKYSQTDSMFGSECFAEIFAISFFGESKYPQFAEKIRAFENLMK